MVTMTLLVVALSFTPRTRIQLSAITTTKAGRLKMAPVNFISATMACESLNGRHVVEQFVDVGGKAHSYRHI